MAMPSLVVLVGLPYIRRAHQCQAQVLENVYEDIAHGDPSICIFEKAFICGIMLLPNMQYKRRLLVRRGRTIRPMKGVTNHHPLLDGSPDLSSSMRGGPHYLYKYLSSKKKRSASCHFSSSHLSSSPTNARSAPDLLHLSLNQPLAMGPTVEQTMQLHQWLLISRRLIAAEYCNTRQAWVRGRWNELRSLMPLLHAILASYVRDQALF
jgi:hypothetical protein